MTLLKPRVDVAAHAVARVTAKVQGPGAVEDIVRGIRIAASLQPALDVLVVGRWWRELGRLVVLQRRESSARPGRLPDSTISAVGHEVDVTLCDLVADARAL